MILVRKPREREVCATRQWPRFECVSRVHGPGVYRTTNNMISTQQYSEVRRHCPCSTMSTCGPPTVSGRAVPRPEPRTRRGNNFRYDGPVARRSAVLSPRRARGVAVGRRGMHTFRAHVKQASRFGYPACYPAWRGHHESLFAITVRTLNAL